VITLAEVGEIWIVTPEDVLLPQPNAASAAARVSSVETFHRIPILPRFLNVRPSRLQPQLAEIARTNIIRPKAKFPSRQNI
jgi:hypothetical protein